MPRSCDRLVLDQTLNMKSPESRMAIVRCGRTDGLVNHDGVGWRCTKHSLHLRESRCLTKQDLKADLLECASLYIYRRRNLARMVEAAYPSLPPKAVLKKLQGELVDAKVDMEAALDRFDRARLQRREVRRVLTLI